MGKLSHDQVLILRQLRLKWALFAGLCLLFLVSGAITLYIIWAPEPSLRWSIITSLAIIYLLVVFWRNLGANHRRSETGLLPSLGWGNLMTLLRGLMIAGLLGFLFSPTPPGWLVWAPGVLYTLVCLADFLDGYLARVTNHVTRLGEVLDMSFDGVGVLGAVLLAIQYGQLPDWYILIAMARYLFLAGMWLRSRSGKVNYLLPPSIRRRGLAGLQMGFLAVMLWPIFSPPGTYIAAALFGLPFLISFLIDWLFVSGAHLPKWKVAHRKIGLALQRWIPTALRAAVLALGIPMLMGRYLSFTSLEPLAQLLTVFETVILFLLTLGAAGRIAAIAGLLILGSHQMIIPLNTTQILLGCAYAGILLIGTGNFSLWRPEERLIRQRAGARTEPVGNLSVEHGA